MSSCCNGSCPYNNCTCYAYNPNFKSNKFHMIISLIKTGLQIYDSDSVKTRDHGKDCLVNAIQLLNDMRVLELKDETMEQV